MQRTFDQNLALYAELMIKEGVALANGQELILTAEIGQAPFVRLLVEEAYKAGAKHVEVLWSDPQVSLARYREASDEAIGYVPMWLVDGITRAFSENAARLGVLSEDPALLADISPERVATSSRAQSVARKRIGELIAGFHINWSLAGAASPGWAKQVFPELPEDQAVTKLWEAIFLTSRVLEENPIAAWQAHCDTLEQRMGWLNDMRLDAVRFKGPGTDLTVGLVENHIWVGGRGNAKNGVTCSPNVPTEEVFTMPHKDRVNGIVSSSKPLSLRGQVVDKIQMEFKDGVAIKATAAKGEETLERLLSSDEGAKKLGEVALVPSSSKVSQAGILFYNSLYDENAASHIAMGASYGENLEGYDDLSEEERLAKGANDSIIHVDWMIGSSEIDVDGLKADGSTIPVMRGGEWV